MYKKNEINFKTKQKFSDVEKWSYDVYKLINWKYFKNVWRIFAVKVNSSSNLISFQSFDRKKSLWLFYNWHKIKIYSRIFTFIGY